MKNLGKVLFIVFVGTNLLIFYYNIKFVKKEELPPHSTQTVDEKSQATGNKPQSEEKPQETGKPQGQPPIPESTIPSGKIIIPFSSGLNLSPQSQEALRKLFNTMSENSKLRIKVTGYTDNQGNPFKNLQLSGKRAQVVQQFLITLGIPRERIIVQGEGNKDPIADNNTEEGRRQNRRVEVTIINN
jgi:OmpA-OmpF porin, OOP family